MSPLSFMGQIKEPKKDIVFMILAAVLTVIIFFIPTGFEREDSVRNTQRVRARILNANNDLVNFIGPLRFGTQELELQVLSGDFKGQVHVINNILTGKLEVDKYFEKGDTALISINLSEDNQLEAIVLIDHYRTRLIFILAALFIIGTIIIMGWMGIKILITFIFTAVMLIKILYPMALHGWDPLIAALIIISVISFVILFIVGGLNRRGLTAFLGTASGIIFTAILALVFTYWFKLHGGVRPFTESLLFAGYSRGSLVHLFIAGIFIAASGAIMDISMNIASAMDEIKEQHPAITRMQLMKSGLIVARQSAGTMTTTLLLAYSAEYMATIMFFIAQGHPLQNIINMVWISSEIVHTLVGCFGLILVAPLTVLFSGLLLDKKRVESQTLT